MVVADPRGCFDKSLNNATIAVWVVASGENTTADCKSNFD